MSDDQSYAKYTLLDDGQDEWYALTEDVIAALVKAGYTYDIVGHYHALAEPEISKGDSDHFSIAFGAPPVDPAIVDLSDPHNEVEWVDYAPATVGVRHLYVSRAIADAVYAATPGAIEIK